MLRRLLGSTILAAALPLAACGGGAAETPPTGDARGDASATSAPAAASVPATGTVIEVRMVTDENGNYFEPKEVEARPGDVVRFVLASGVHNVSFPEDRNPDGARLPDAGPYLQLPGQTYDVAVDFAPGEYFFQCDPHAPLGMIGFLTVKSD